MNVVHGPPRFAEPIEVAAAEGGRTIANVEDGLDLVDRILRGRVTPHPALRAKLAHARDLLLDARRTWDPDAIAAARSALKAALGAGGKVSAT